MSHVPVPQTKTTLNLRPLTPSTPTATTTPKLYRSANPSGSPDSLAHLLSDPSKLRISTVIDLRGKAELSRDTQGKVFRNCFTNETDSLSILNGYGPARRLFHLDFSRKMTLEALKTVSWIDLLWCFGLLLLCRFHEAKKHAIEKSFLGRENGLAVFYQKVLQVHGKNIRKVFEILAHENAYPVLIHCSAGKDRTGICFALVHRLIGTSDAEILRDYMQSNEELKSMRGLLVKEVAGVGLRVDEFVDVNEVALVEMLAWIDEKGGVEAYLESIGVSKEVQARVRHNLLK
ncbi:hypothetical protein BCR33DRAFT_718657 [Rhizoclosmatium globosum]|uniref:Tyrosine specific protein phosphatases domain-containing protein n=1 Tax=Rhizoclosmatium globosum TaxID=329046 RepID=A0A1Y2C4S8_9FUNG|nr:hypothetical protein BCR33DRAFT_718657 [Rhizoclosmatium globosum]|eukprot:ORY42042.1 hypothetical protein BCR33DRAFT_718657 [Rhizoclosmatium globosum]